MKSLKQILLENGVKESDIANHESDLYCKKSLESEKALKEYEKALGHSVGATTFIDNITKEIWFDVPFGYMPEHFNSKC